jgi:hypothetical protein
MNIDRLDVARECRCGKTVAAGKKAYDKSDYSKKQQSGHIPGKHAVNLKTNVQGE